jgi:hypothetical protein
MMCIDSTLEAAKDGGFHKLFGGSFGRSWNEQIMICNEQREEVVIGSNKGRRVAGGGPRGERTGIDGFELPVV